MKSAVALTDEIDDLETAASELCATIRAALEFEKSTVGIVYCDADVEVAELGKRLHESLGIDIIGATTAASIERHSGYHNMTITLAVLTGDDIDIAIGTTGELAPDTFAQQIPAAYGEARARLPEDPKLIVLCAPYVAAITAENYVDILDELSGHAPVFGGVATDHYDIQYQKTFLNGQAYDGGLVFLMLSGAIRPVFAMKHSFGAKTERKGIITQSSGNRVERVGDQTFTEYLADITPLPDEDMVIYHFQSTPFIMELPDYEESEEPVVRALCALDLKAGSGGFLSTMPEGSALSINVLHRDNLQESCANTLDILLEKMRRDSGYRYSMVLISSCNARHLLMGDRKDIEAQLVVDKLAGLDPAVNAIGFYGFGEYCPTADSADGGVKNRFHNVSFALCAF